MNFAEKLALIMKKQEITESKLAEYIGKEKSDISQYLSGNSIPRTKTKERMTEILGCTVEDLTNDADEEDIYLHKVPVAIAAKKLGKSQQSVRIALQRGVAPYGYACLGTGKIWDYHISPKKLEDYIGENMQDDEQAST